MFKRGIEGNTMLFHVSAVDRCGSRTHVKSMTSYHKETIKNLCFHAPVPTINSIIVISR